LLLPFETDLGLTERVSSLKKRSAVMGGTSDYNFPENKKKEFYYSDERIGKATPKAIFF
jgi:hypothetical protein